MEQLADLFAEVAAEERQLLHLRERLRWVKDLITGELAAVSKPDRFGWIPAGTKKIKTVRVVTTQHAEIFVREWFRVCEDLWEAFGATDIMEWPLDAKAQRRYMSIEEEIHRRVFHLLRRVAFDAFEQAASGFVVARARGGGMSKSEQPDDWRARLRAAVQGSGWNRLPSHGKPGSHRRPLAAP